MKVPGLRQPLPTLFFLFLLILTVLAGDLGLRLDPSSEKADFFIWNSILTLFSGQNARSDGDLVGYAAAAFREMTEDFKTRRKAVVDASTADKGNKDKLAALKRFPKKAPTVMTAIEVGDTIYLSSSVRGGDGSSFLLQIQASKGEDTLIVKKFFECQTELEGSAPGVEGEVRHQNNASCGEILSLHIRYSDGDKVPLDQKGRMVTVEADKSGTIKIKPPCRPGEAGGRPGATNGCQSLVDHLGSNALEVVAPSVEVPVTAPGYNRYNPRYLNVLCDKQG
ncbi:MAG: hypothetical protein Q9160_003790 [Pyrenula sp. 1 TL-2023]